MEDALLAKIHTLIPEAIIRERARSQYAERCRAAEESLAVNRDAFQREKLRKMMSWEAFERFLSEAR
jgi:hypothetical protein